MDFDRSKHNVIKYLPTNNDENIWGMSISGIGFQSIDPKGSYPLKGHPIGYTFNPDRGRIIDEFALVYIVKGEGTFASINCFEKKISKGDAFFIFPGQWHSYQPIANIGWDEYYVTFQGDYFEKLFSENGISSFSIKQSKDELKKIRDSLSGPQKQNIEVKNKIKEMENMIKQQESERKSTLEILNMAKVTLPYVRFVMTKECLIVLNDDCFRDNPNNIAFKYGGNIQIVGYVTNIIDGESRTENQINAFSEMYKMVNQVMMSLYNGTKHVYVIHPLAMYY